MNSHYFQYLVQKGVSKKKLNLVKEIDKQGFHNINYLSLENVPNNKVTYTFVKLRSTNSNNVELHVIFPGLDFGLSSHIFTAWDVMIEAYYKDKKAMKNVDYLLIPPISALGNRITQELLKLIHSEKLNLIKHEYTKWINKFIDSQNNNYSKIIFHGVSAGCNYAYLIGSCFADKYNLELQLDNPSLLLNNNPFRIIQISMGFLTEGIYRVIFDERVRTVVQNEKNVIKYLVQDLDTKNTDPMLHRRVALELAWNLLNLKQFPSYAIRNCSVTIGKYDMTCFPFHSIPLLPNAKNSIINEGHYIYRVKGFFE